MADKLEASRLTPETLRALAEDEDVSFPANIKIEEHADAWAADIADRERDLSQEVNGSLCDCRFEDEMMGKVPEGSFCPFCQRRRYESAIVALADSGKETTRLRRAVAKIMDIQSSFPDGTCYRIAIEALSNVGGALAVEADFADSGKGMPMEFLGRPIAYWVELDNYAKEMDVDKLIGEIERLREQLLVRQIESLELREQLRAYRGAERIAHDQMEAPGED